MPLAEARAESIPPVAAHEGAIVGVSDESPRLTPGKGMSPIELLLGLFANSEDDANDFTGLNRKNSERVVEAILRTMTLANRLYLREHPRTPPIYRVRGWGLLRFEHDPPGAAFTRWHGIPGVIHRGKGDCKELSPWRAAELLERGSDARNRAYLVRPGLYHVVVEREPDPRIFSKVPALREKADLPPGTRPRRRVTFRGHEVILVNEFGPTLYWSRDRRYWIEDPSRGCGMTRDGE